MTIPVREPRHWTRTNLTQSSKQPCRNPVVTPVLRVQKWTRRDGGPKVWALKHSAVKGAGNTMVFALVRPKTQDEF